MPIFNAIPQVRASTFVSGLSGKDPKDVNVTVVGGHSGVTIVPLLSQQTEGASILKEGGQKLADLVKRIQFGGDEVVKAKDGASFITLCDKELKWDMLIVCSV
jgi:malate dehydrogenase